METVKLYYEDAYLTSFMEEIRECIEREDGTFELVMDRTAFFPEEGGQSPDRGTIAGVPVIDVQIRDGVIYHVTEAPVPAGSEAVCHIDWDHRFSNMQQHSGEHLFSGIAHRDYGCENVGFHLSDNEVTLDLNKPLTEEQILDIEKKVNEAIFKNIESIALYPTKEEACSMEYRSKKEIDGQLRLIVYPGIDTCACCAPHVAKTGEIGILKVVSFMNNKGGVRINILCGGRALKDYEIKRKAIDAAGKLLSANQDNIKEVTEKLLREKADLIYELVGVKRRLFAAELDKIEDGSENIILFPGKWDDDILRNGLNSLMERCRGYIAFFSGEEGRYRFYIGSPDTDVKELLEKLKGRLPIKGGGGPRMVQGNANTTEAEIREAMACIL